jgi:diguanylate cyclase (GGDEF)-like protein
MRHGNHPRQETDVAAAGAQNSCEADEERRSSPDLTGGLWDWEPERDLLSCSPEAYRLHGLQPPHDIDGGLLTGPVSGAAWFEALRPENRQSVEDVARRVLAAGSGEQEYKIRSGRRSRWLRLHAEILRGPDGRITRVVGFTHDVTAGKSADAQRRQAQRELALQRSILQRVAAGEPLHETLVRLCRHVERQLHGARCTVLLLDRSAGVLRHGACPTLPPAFSDELDGLPVGEGMGACGTAAARGEPVIVSDVMSDPLTADFIDVAVRYEIASVWSHPLRKSGGEVLGTFAVYRSSTFMPPLSEQRMVTTIGYLAAMAIDRSQADAALRAAANYDSLTGLPNRARFLEMVNRQLQDSERRLSVLFIEIDRFKQINDGFGHIAGDRVLVEVGRRLRDVASGGGPVSRFGGYTFTMMAPFASPRQLKELSVRALDAIAQPVELDGAEFVLTASIGIASNERPTDAYGLVRDADVALYASRSAGHGRTQVYDRKLRADVVTRLTRETELRRAIEHGGLVMYYQPIMSLKQRCWSGVEALVRWQHPKRGLMGPGEFIPLAEESGLIVPLGAEVMRLVGEQVRHWASTLPGLHIGVNASVLQLARTDMADAIMSMIDYAEIEPGTLMLEVTESALMEQLDTTRGTLERLVHAGVKVLIDDFGTGYSSIARLGELPISGLKIDKRFTLGLGTDPAVLPVVRAISDLARAYGLQVVAEGIEDESALRAVAELGCQYAQGFHLGPPVPADRIEELLARPLPAGAGAAEREQPQPA